MTEAKNHTVPVQFQYGAQYGAMTEAKNHTVPVQFQYSAQYGAHNEYSTDGNSFQDHHTLHTSYDSYNSKTD